MHPKITISVTANDIAEGWPCSTSNCPIALAANRAFPGRTVAVRGGSLSLYGGIKKQTYYLPNEAIEFIRSFDCGSKIEPFEFDITLDH